MHQKRAKEIGLRIKNVRGKLNQSEFATMLGVHRSTLSRYERGEFEPSIDFLDHLCSNFGININWLLFGKGPKCLSEKASTLIQQPGERKTTKEKKGMGEKQVLNAPGTINVTLLAQILEGIDVALNEMSLELAPDKKAELTALLYEHFDAVGVKKETIKRFLKLVA
ncbi:helix-turn-helix domain-containing protein [Desulfovulcanus sp.]